MAHPKSKISKQRKRKRRTHKKLTEPQVAICAKTGEAHLMHRAYWHEGSMYYNGQMVIQASADADDVSFTEV